MYKSNISSSLLRAPSGECRGSTPPSQTNGRRRRLSTPTGSRVRQIIEEFNSVVAKSDRDAGMEPVSPRADESVFAELRHQPQQQQEQDNSKPHQEDPMEGWEQRLAASIQWIRDEVAELKKQDKSLTRQFIELRSVIHHLRRYGFINRLPNTLQEDAIPVNERVEAGDTTPTNTPPITPGTPQLSPRKNPPVNRYQTLPSKKHLNHPRGPGEPKASPPKHFFTDDSSLESDSDSTDDTDDDLSGIGYRPRAVSVLTPTWINSPSPGGNFLNRSRNMSFTSGATEDEYDC